MSPEVGSAPSSGQAKGQCFSLLVPSEAKPPYVQYCKIAETPFETVRANTYLDAVGVGFHAL
jgi:hypothetical protein